MLDDHFAFLLFLLCFSRFSCITSMICFKISTAILPRQPLFFPHCSFLSFKYTYSTHWQPKAINSQYAWLVERNVSNSPLHTHTHTHTHRKPPFLPCHFLDRQIMLGGRMWRNYSLNLDQLSSFRIISSHSSLICNLQTLTNKPVRFSTDHAS